ncbi:hypothetical protein [Pleionea sp. CnH1-48]|uniref:hypothetical protein n=1 Tax=Pleionea sp. CnH1-48 TaxID=2954494 RepID=UPI002096A953|nr:hypothetical protein [Pleionea sp. CnH1-48]MCO7226581.1 hypothetical protein [Pleionea sp. CnH1-48]
MLKYCKVGAAIASALIFHGTALSATSVQCASYHYEDIKGVKTELFEIKVYNDLRECPPPSNFRGEKLILNRTHQTNTSIYYDNQTHGNASCVIETQRTVIENGMPVITL